MINAVTSSPIMIHFSVLPDPRKPRNQLYTLFDLISTSILATLCGFDDYDDMSFWVEQHLPWLHSIGICLEGAPSHDTYERFFRHLDSDIFQKCFIEWTETLAKTIKGVIAIDGKTIRGSRDENNDVTHIVSAFAAENNLILVQLKCSGRGNELATIQKLLRILDIKGVIVTIDAAGCHRIIAKEIYERKADYILALKANQPLLYNEVSYFFEEAIKLSAREADCDYWCSEETARGRKEKREVWSCEILDWLPQLPEWAGLKSIICVKSQRICKGKQSEEYRFYISSLPADSERLGKSIRSHWGIENKVHWQLDVTYREDSSRVRRGNGAENLSTLRRATLNLLKQDKSSKHALKRRRAKALLDREYLLSLIGVK